MDKKPTGNVLKTAAVKSVTAILCAALASYAISTSVSSMSEARKAAAQSKLDAYSSFESGSYSDADIPSDAAFSDPGSVPSAGTDTAADTGAATDTGADTSADASPADSGSSDSGTASAGTQTDAKPAAENKSGAFQSNAEIINYCNKALNDAKQAKVGYTKTFVRTCDPSLPSIVSSIINQNKVTTVAKGSDKIVDDFPAGGFTWSCKLREQDVSKVEFKQNGQYYEITLRLGNEHNPGKGETSKYGRAMTVVDAADAKEMLAAVKSVDFTYHDGYVYAKIDSKTGKLVKAEFSATADLVGEIAIIGNLSTKNLKSTETFTDIKW